MQAVSLERQREANQKKKDLSMSKVSPSLKGRAREMFELINKARIGFKKDDEK